MQNRELIQHYYVRRELLSAYFAARMFGLDDIAQLALKQLARFRNC